MKIEVGKEYKTSDGETMLVVYKSQADRKFIFLAVNKENDDEVWYSEDGQSSDQDIVGPAPQKIKVEGWVNVYPEQFDFNTMYSDKKLADHFAANNRIACKRIEFEVEEGEGL